jgi:AAA domain
MSTAVEAEWPTVMEGGSTSSTPADFTYERGIARALWTKPQRIELVFDQLHVERRTAEVGAEVTVSAGGRMLHRGRINLTSTRSRIEVVKFLTLRLTGVDWTEIVEESCWKVIDAHRQGRAAVLLRDAKPPPGGRFALPPFLLARQPVMLFGNGGDWKSYLALAAGLSLHTNREVIAGLKPSAPFRVGYFDWEWDSWEHLERMRALLGPDNLPDIVYVPCASEGPLETQVDRLRAKIREHRLDFGIFDSVGLGCSGAPEEAEAALGYLRALGRLEIGSLNLAHVNRSGTTASGRAGM